MTNLLIFRDQIKSIIQRYDKIAIPVIKFLVMYVLMSVTNNMYGYATFLNRSAIIVFISLVGAWIPYRLMYFIWGIVSTVHLIYLSPELAVIQFLLVTMIYLLYLRFDLKISVIMTFAPIAFVFGFQAVYPILIGMFLGPIGIVPAAMGILIYYISVYAKEVSVILNTTTTEETIQAYQYILEQVKSDPRIVLTMIATALVILVTYFLYQNSRENAWQIAIITGGITNIVVTLAGSFISHADTNIAGVLFFTICSMVIASIVQFFRCVVDYSRIENVQFEDDEYYYYVKAIPKMVVAERKVDVKRIRTRKRSKKERDR